MPVPKTHQNEFHIQLDENIRKVNHKNRILQAISVTFASVGAIVLSYVAVANNNFLPITTVCFNPEIVYEPYKTIPKQEGRFNKFCSSGANIFPMLTPYYEKLTQDNVDFAVKVFVVNQFDNSLQTTKLILGLCVGSGIVGLLAASGMLHNLRENKNAFYQKTHSEYKINQLFAEASETVVNTEFEGMFKEPEPLLHPLVADIQTAELQKQLNKELLEGTELEKKILKTRRDIESAFSLKDSETTDENAKDKNDDNIQFMIDALKSHEGGWLWQLVEGNLPIWLTGRMGTGKTWTLASIALIRKYCCKMSVRYVIDVHGLGENKAVWDLLNPQDILAVGVKGELNNITEAIERDKAKIAEGFREMIESYAKRINNSESKNNKIQDIIDEYTNLKQDKIIGDEASEWYREHLTSSRKAYAYITAATHNDTNAAYPDGTKVQRDTQTALIEKKSANEAPLSNCTVVRGLFDSTGEQIDNSKKHFPIWFAPQIIFNHVTGVELIDFDEYEGK